MQPLRRIAFAVNAAKTGAERFAAELAQTANACGASATVCTAYPIPDDLLMGLDACCTVGGDGTLLSAVPAAIKADVPIIGVNQGKLGFLATFSPQEAREGLKQMIQGFYTVAERDLLACRNEESQIATALNDVVIKSMDVRRLIALRVFCDGEWVTDYSSDGIIFATPTGSTAYNLSAGGPLVQPGCGVTTMTPICPHTLTNRSMVFPGSCCLTVECPETEVLPQVTIDGSQRFEGQPNFRLHIQRCDRRLKLLPPRQHPYFSILRTKLKWGGEG